MFASTNDGASNDWHLINSQAQALWEDRLPLWSNLANLSALLKLSLDELNWAGFYLWSPEHEALVLGPFQGLPACTIIPAGKGVCGSAWQSGRPLRVPDVHAFPGHIACDSQSRSELVVPIPGPPGAAPLGVIDLDSPRLDRFSAADCQGLELLAAFIGERAGFQKSV